MREYITWQEPIQSNENIKKKLAARCSCGSCQRFRLLKSQTGTSLLASLLCSGGANPREDWVKKRETRCDSVSWRLAGPQGHYFCWLWNGTCGPNPTQWAREWPSPVGHSELWKWRWDLSTSLYAMDRVFLPAACQLSPLHYTTPFHWHRQSLFRYMSGSPCSLHKLQRKPRARANATRQNVLFIKKDRCPLRLSLEQCKDIWI